MNFYGPKSEIIVILRKLFKFVFLKKVIRENKVCWVEALSAGLSQNGSKQNFYSDSFLIVNPYFDRTDEVHLFSYDVRTQDTVETIKSLGIQKYVFECAKLFCFTYLLF